MPRCPTFSATERTYLGGFLAGLRQRDTPGMPCLPAQAPLAAETRLWFDGLLAGLYSQLPASEPTPSAPATGPADLLVLWAFQTGNAEALAKRCAQRLGATG